MILGKCPNCNSDVIAVKTTARNQSVNLYTCINAKKEHDDSGQFVFTSDSSCNFRVYSNLFSRWNKRSFSKYEMKNLLEKKEIKIRLHGRKGTGEYYKYAVLDPDYGVSILWDQDVEN